MSSLRQRWEDRYTSGSTPWDTGTTPPEVEAFWQSGRLEPSGLALDVGCGPGTNVRYLARIGLTAIGVDIALTALFTGHERIRRGEPELIDRTFLVQADITAVAVVGSQRQLHSRRWLLAWFATGLAPGICGWHNREFTTQVATIISMHSTM